MSRYRCNHCHKVVTRDSDQRWIKSYCEATGRSTRLWRVEETPGDGETPPGP